MCDLIANLPTPPSQFIPALQVPFAKSSRKGKENMPAKHKIIDESDDVVILSETRVRKKQTLTPFVRIT